MTGANLFLLADAGLDLLRRDVERFGKECDPQTGDSGEVRDGPRLFVRGGAFLVEPERLLLGRGDIGASSRERTWLGSVFASSSSAVPSDISSQNSVKRNTIDSPSRIGPVESGEKCVHNTTKLRHFDPVRCSKCCERATNR